MGQLSNVQIGRRITNIIRFIMDELLPAFIRDNRFFMFPFYYLAYGGKNISYTMDFKKHVYKMSEKEYSDFYSSLNSISKNRLTDLNQPSIKYIVKNLDARAETLIDVGCGKGYFLNRMKNQNLKLSGCDIFEKAPLDGIKYQKASVDHLPFRDQEFDIVTCFHTLEHILNLKKAVHELERITKRQLVVVVPRQRYFYYTLDEHVNFFDFEEKLTSLFSFKNYECRKIWGDWVFIGTPDDGQQTE